MAKSGSITEPQDYLQIPQRWVGPVHFTFNGKRESIEVPLATYETPLWPSVQRGALISKYIGGFEVSVERMGMARSIVLRAATNAKAIACQNHIIDRQHEISKVAESKSRFAKFNKIDSFVLGCDLYLRLNMFTGDASGHNMVTQAADNLMQWLLEEYPELSYGSISANWCSDKKVSAVNSLLGRGRRVHVEALIHKKYLKRILKTDAHKVEKLHVQKNLQGSLLAGSLMSANAHYANMLLGFYLSTGQDASNIVEASQGINVVEARGDDLYFSCTMPNLIVGTVGNGKHLPQIQETLSKLGCQQEEIETGVNSDRLAALCGLTVLCCELSLMAAQTNPKELMQAHTSIERSNS